MKLSPLLHQPLVLTCPRTHTLTSSTSVLGDPSLVCGITPTQSSTGTTGKPKGWEWLGGPAEPDRAAPVQPAWGTKTTAEDPGALKAHLGAEAPLNTEALAQKEPRTPQTGSMGRWLGAECRRWQPESQSPALSSRLKAAMLGCMGTRRCSCAGGPGCPGPGRRAHSRGPGAAACPTHAVRRRRGQGHTQTPMRPARGSCVKSGTLPFRSEDNPGSRKHAPVLSSPITRHNMSGLQT